MKKSLSNLFFIGITLFTILLLSFLIYVAIILVWSPPKNLEKHEAIVVLTGSKGRIEQGFQLLLEQAAPRLLISGVTDNVPFDDIIRSNSDTLNQSQTQTLRDHCCIDLDYIANSTETNATESSRWIRGNDIKSIILVTSAQHMPRAFFLFRKYTEPTLKITAYPQREGSRIELVISKQFWQYAAHEYIKFGGNLIRLEKQQ